MSQRIAHRECYTISIIYSNVLTTSNAGVVLLHGFTSLAAPGHSLRLGLVACALRPDYSTSGRSLYPMTSSSAGLDCSEERPPRYARTLTHAHTHSSKDRENVENVIRTMRHGAYPHPPLAPRDSPSRTLSLSCFSIASPFLSHNPHSYLEHFTSFLFVVFREVRFLLPELCSKLESGMKFIHNKY